MKIGAMLIVGSGEGEKFLKEVLDMLDKLVDVIFIWGDAPDKLTEDIILSYPKANYYRSDKAQWGKLQWKIKETLLTKYIVPTDIEWLVCLDADEIFDYRINRKILEELTTRGEIAFYFNFVTLWNDRDHMRCDGSWGSFENVRFFKIIRELNQTYRQTPLHCGLAPAYAYQWGANCEYIMKHYGYMQEEDRLKKIERYNKYDSKQIYQSPNWYNSINSGAVIRSFNEEEFVKRFKYVSKQPRVERIMQEKIQKVVFVKNQYGKVNAIPESLLPEVLNIPGMVIYDKPKEDVEPKAIKIEPPRVIVKTPIPKETRPEKIKINTSGKSRVIKYE